MKYHHNKTGLTINSDSTISWKDIENWFDNPTDFKRFQDWMIGQTCTENGVFVWDFEKYISKDRNIEN